MKAICLSGWGQPHDALSDIIPDAVHLEYARHEPGDTVFGELKPYRDAKLAIGWSLGGQLLVRAISKGVIRPEKLVLIATPYHFVKSKELSVGMGAETFRLFRDNFHRNAERTLRKSYALIAYNDRNSDEVTRRLSDARKRLIMHDWLGWLDELEKQTCHGLNFVDFPQTLLLHGDQDAVVEPENSKMFHSQMQNASLHVLEGCGHAPHWHHPEKVKKLIREFAGA